MVKIGIAQMLVVNDKQANIDSGCSMIEEAAGAGCEMVVLPEMFNCPYDPSLFHEYAEEYPDGHTIKSLAEAAARNGVFVVGGSIPERDGNTGLVYNTSFVFNPDGSMIARHRKVHLFDVDLDTGLSFKESDLIAPGDEITLFDTPFGKVGVLICYDIRFPEFLTAMVLEGATMVVVPAAFNTTTGPAHWEILFRARAVDNQVYIVGAAPAYNPDIKYNCYGHSILVDPWGRIEKQADNSQQLLFCDMDPSKVMRIRKQLPQLKHRRRDIYEILLKRNLSSKM